jgi:hypothetical protein
MSAFSMREWMMRLPWYDSPTPPHQGCRAVTGLLNLSKHRGSRLFMSHFFKRVFHYTLIV